MNLNRGSDKPPSIDDDELPSSTSNNNEDIKQAKSTSEWWQELSVKLNVWKNTISHNVASLLTDTALSLPSSSTHIDTSQNTQTSIYLLGTCYNISQEHFLFWAHFRSLLWMTYRTDFEAIHDTIHTSDIGWGCMVRSGQAMLAYTLCLHILGKSTIDDEKWM